MAAIFERKIVRCGARMVQKNKIPLLLLDVRDNAIQRNARKKMLRRCCSACQRTYCIYGFQFTGKRTR
jgi:hypothetical protein